MFSVVTRKLTSMSACAGSTTWKPRAVSAAPIAPLIRLCRMSLLDVAIEFDTVAGSTIAKERARPKSYVLL
ncbi:MAG: hypothetical protein IPM40_21295 [Gammaproteobacteria bacterium]|nr:hypothetical protein [Gammaproteobacteria bacterium]